jgi:hypothetical protein
VVIVLSILLRYTTKHQRGNQNPYIKEEQTTQWPNENVQKDKQRSTKRIIWLSNLLTWYLVVIVLSILLRYTDSHYFFGILLSLCCLFVLDIRILITHLVSSNSSCIQSTIYQRGNQNPYI